MPDHYIHFLPLYQMFHRPWFQVYVPWIYCLRVGCRDIHRRHGWNIERQKKGFDINSFYIHRILAFIHYFDHFLICVIYKRNYNTRLNISPIGYKFVDDGKLVDRIWERIFHTVMRYDGCHGSFVIEKINTRQLTG